jgi:cholesterol oxidase
LPSFVAEVGKAPITGLVDRTVDRALSARFRKWRLLAFLDRKLGVIKALVKFQKRIAYWMVGKPETIADHVLRAALAPEPRERTEFITRLLGYSDEAAERRALLLAMGEDETPGVLLYNAERQRLIADLDLYHLAPRYAEEELLMKEIAQTLGGELRVNPSWAFLGKPITVHSLGGCRMSDDQRYGVTDANGKVHGCDGLYVMDGSVVCTPIGVNPAATIASVAERNVLEFIRKHRKHWPDGYRDRGARQYVEARDAAKSWAEMAKHEGWQLRPPAPPPVAFSSKPIGLTFSERMQGFCFQAAKDPKKKDRYYRLLEMRGRPSNRVVLSLTASVQNLARFFEDQEHALELRGSIDLNLPDGTELSGCKATGSLKLMVPRYKPYGLEDADQIQVQTTITGKEYMTQVLPTTGTAMPEQPEERAMHYCLHFGDGHGRSWRLDGYKRIRQDPGLDAWRDTTTLFIKVSELPHGSVSTNGSPARIVAAGAVHVDLTGFLYDQLRSMEVTGTDDPARIVWATTTFARFFFCNLQRIYVPRLNGVLDALGRPPLSNVPPAGSVRL